MQGFTLTVGLCNVWYCTRPGVTAVCHSCVQSWDIQCAVITSIVYYVLLCLTGEGIKVVASIHNKSSRDIRPKYCLYKKCSYFAKGKRKVQTKDILKEVGDPIPPSAGQTVTRVITIPPDTCVSILNCIILRVEYRLRVCISLHKTCQHVCVSDKWCWLLSHHRSIWMSSTLQTPRSSSPWSSCPLYRVLTGNIFLLIQPTDLKAMQLQAQTCREEPASSKTKQPVALLLHLHPMRHTGRTPAWVISMKNHRRSNIDLDGVNSQYDTWLQIRDCSVAVSITVSIFA